MRSIKPEELKNNAFSMIGKEWLLITAEKEGKVNTMFLLGAEGDLNHRNFFHPQLVKGKGTENGHGAEGHDKRRQFGES